MNIGNELNEFRQDINAIDDELVALLERRAEVVKRVGEWKRMNGVNVYSAERENELVDRLARALKTFPQSGLRAIYAEIFKVMRVLQIGPEVGKWHSKELPQGIGLCDGERVLLYVDQKESNRVTMIIDAHNAALDNVRESWRRHD